MPTSFEPTRSFCYRFARYTVLPAVQKMPTVVGGDPFRLTDLAQEVIDLHLNEELQQTRIKKAQSERTDSAHSIIKFFTVFLAREQQLFVPLGRGQYRSTTADDVSDTELEEVEEDEDAQAAEYDGWIYAFSFPALVRTDSPFPVKVGKTIGDVENRVAQQCKGSASFENPVILGRWQVQRIGPTELAIHNTLKARGKWRESAPGTEWFDTCVDEISAIVAFVTGRVKHPNPRP